MAPAAGKPRIVERPEEMREIGDDARDRGRRIALVPTMGALHRGHLQLVQEARRRGDLVVVSIFVNPTQFGPGEDLDRYPRDLEGDLQKLAAHDTDIAFTPNARAMYPEGHATSVHLERLTDGLCGADRPGHFDGVATIVTKLFQIVGPCTAIFGRKDYQQLKVIQRMTRDLYLPVEIVGLPTVREPDGLALSSRNVYLSGAERQRALALARGLATAHSRWTAGERKVGPLRSAVADPVAESFDGVDYVTAADPESLAPRDDDETATGALLIAAAARIGSTRLIDNTVLGEDEPPPAEPIDG
jgi:pantoate--beta-alanine ligase